ncbi:hypothetical protein CROQUDRAFT_105622 [Cronartium quercuum f. sp. fusiforme G11]|uniref:Uncharacterized protein n=1 Tax=Cronartium quercuum f. sp. fusiforme G11 TaxID=708437 RepID=A0A9P6TED2_9BASI|nr:hypothetical protein CROQUDRAFT_105622 [Cronartium quercuum f. sp. fusiforme G11]
MSSSVATRLTVYIAADTEPNDGPSFKIKVKDARKKLRTNLHSATAILDDPKAFPNLAQYLIDTGRFNHLCSYLPEEDQVENFLDFQSQKDSKTFSINFHHCTRLYQWSMPPFASLRTVFQPPSTYLSAVDPPQARTGLRNTGSSLIRTGMNRPPHSP